MGKFGWAAIAVMVAALVADQYWNSGYYTDAASAMLRQMRHSFGW
jgi:RimJ/RimL family protein N-acetyltransferase